MTEQEDLNRNKQELQSEQEELSHPDLDALDELDALEDEDDDDLLPFSAKPEESVDAAAGGRLAGEEIRPVAAPVQKGPSNLPLMLLLLVVVLVGVGYYLMTIGSSEQASQPALATVAKKQPMPDRQAVQEPVAEESVEQPPIAAIGTPVADKPVEPKVVETATVKAAEETVAATPATVKPQIKPQVAVEKPAPAKTATPQVPTVAAEYSVLVGPFITSTDLKNATAALKERGFSPQQTKGRGVVSMTRLLEGVYPPSEARQRIAEIKEKTGDAFVLPTGENLAIYVGSFSDEKGATKQMELLAKKGVKVSLVNTDVTMDGKMLIAVQTDQEDARNISDSLNKSGFKTQVVRK